MSIRTKLLILLLLIAVLPMAIAVLVGQVSTRLVGDRLTEATQRDLVSLAESRILSVVRDGASLAGSEAQTIELMVTLQARAVGEALASVSEQPDTIGPGVFLAREHIDNAEGIVPGLETTTWTEHGTGGARRTRRVTREGQSFVFAPGTDPDRQAREINALASLTPLLKLMAKFDPGFVDGHYTATIDGVHAKFPGHGGYPEDFDPRDRIWFKMGAASLDAKTSEPSHFWGPPIVDATTGRVMVTVSMGVAGPDGRLAAVTAVDLYLRGMLDGLLRDPVWDGHEEVFIASLIGSGAGVGDTALSIYAQRAYEEADGAGDWRNSIKTETFALDDPELSRELVRHIERQQSGVMHATRDGTLILCAYAPILTGGESTATGLVITVPFAEVVAIASSIDREFWGIVATQLRSNVAIAAVVLLVVVVVAFRGARYVTKPVEDVAEAVAAVASGDLEARAEVVRDDEIGRLARHFNAMVPKLRDRVKLRQSLDLAMEVQQALLPGEAPEVDGLDVDGHSIYCDETGGDYYDFMVVQPIDEQHLWLVMGDVTGHGIAAALLMTTARAIVRSRVGTPGSIAEHVNALNAQLAADNQHGRFMTMCVLLLDRATGRMRWVLAGHDAPIVYDPASRACRELDDARGGIPLGIDGAWMYEEDEGPIVAPGEVLVVGTDGIWEARDGAGEMYGKDRLKRVIASSAAGSAREIREAIVADVEAFRGATPQLDDITLLIVKGR